MKTKLLLFTFLFCWYIQGAAAAEITLIYTGETHAMLYPCDCPVEPDGGVSRRATIIDELRKRYPDALLVDAGGFFAGGVQDEYSQNVEIDMRRTDLALRAMEMMGYDAAAVSDDEFNFGTGFLMERASGRVPLVSCTVNDEQARLKPFVLKKTTGATIALIGATPQSANRKAIGVTITDPKEAVRQAVKQAALAGADVIVLLSQLGEFEDRVICAEIAGIDAVVSSQLRNDAAVKEKIGQTVYLRSAWQGRKLGIAHLTVEKGAVADFRVEEVRVSADYQESPRIQAFLPQCFVDTNCRRINPAAICQNGGTQQSACVVEKGNPVTLTIITSKDCAFCSTDMIVNSLKERMPGLKTVMLQYPEARARNLLKDVGAIGLPVYLLGPEVEKEKTFDALRESLEKRHGLYMIKPEIAGISYLVTRPQTRGTFDLFIRAHDPRTPGFLEATAPFSPTVHFITEGTTPPVPQEEVEDSLRALCVRDMQPEAFAAYVSCRAGASGSSWWEDCAQGLDLEALKVCARGERGRALLSENTALTKELKVGTAPTYLLDNQQIFSTDKIPTEDELKSIMKP